MHRRADLLRKGRASLDHMHEVMFAVQLQNMDYLEAILLDVSNPSSPNYGDYMTKAEVTEMTSNPIANQKIKEYLLQSGASIVSETHGGEYISAKGSIELWEKMFNTEFFVFHHTRVGSEMIEVIRAEKYSVPLILDNYVASVFHTIQMPLHIKSVPAMTPIDLTDEILPFPTATSITYDEEGKYNPSEVRSNMSSIHEMKKMHENRILSDIHLNGRYGYITPSVLRSAYNLDGSYGSTVSTQGLFETLTQSYSPSDLLSFQNLYGLSKEGKVISIGDHESDAACLDNGYDCIEGNLDIQYMMGMAENAPTTYWWTEPSNSFGGWLRQVSDMTDPPLVFSIR